MLETADISVFTIPERVDNSMTGSQFGLSIENVAPGAKRELAIYQQLELGNVPDFMRVPRLLTLSDEDHTLVLQVLPDVLCVGTDDDFLRVPLLPTTAQRVADLFSGQLPTPCLSDAMWAQADVKLTPTTMPPTLEMVTTRWFIDHHAKVEKQRAGRGGLVRGHKKDIVVANTLAAAAFPKRVGIYGWHMDNGTPIQGLNPGYGMPFSHTHDMNYVDYSHGVHLVGEVMELDGNAVDIADIALDPVLAPLINGRSGPLLFLRYPIA